MTLLVGPVYVAHPYSAPAVDCQWINVCHASQLSTAVNLHGAATISPLQESRGREEAFSESGWVASGLILLRVCKAIVLPDYFRISSGCRAELAEAERLGIPRFFATVAFTINKVDVAWLIEPAFDAWVESERAAA
jgi:hypothetical protein